MRTLIVALLTALPAALTAQGLGPFRQFLAVEPYYTYVRLDGGAGQPDLGLSGGGARLWINGEPFHLPGHSAIALFFSRVPFPRNRGASVTHYGAQVDLFLMHRPLGGLIDPFISVGLGAFRTHIYTPGSDALTVFGVSPGGGIRIPLPNRFQLRADARDVMTFNGRTSHSLEIQGAFGITF